MRGISEILTKLRSYCPESKDEGNMVLARSIFLISPESKASQYFYCYPNHVIYISINLSLRLINITLLLNLLILKELLCLYSNCLITFSEGVSVSLIQFLNYCQLFEKRWNISILISSWLIPILELVRQYF